VEVKGREKKEEGAKKKKERKRYRWRLEIRMIQKKDRSSNPAHQRRTKLFE
jgi:hypothetical protein